MGKHSLHSDFLLFALLSLNNYDIHKQFALYFLFTKKKKDKSSYHFFVLPKAIIALQHKITVQKTIKN